MIGAGHALHEMTKSWLEKRAKRAEARGEARVSAKMTDIRGRIKAQPAGSRYRIELESYMDRMLEAKIKGEPFDEPLPDYPEGAATPSKGPSPSSQRRNVSTQ